MNPGTLRGLTGSSAGRRAVVVGAGPVGCLAAQILSRHGYSVSVYEKRPHFVERGIAEEGRTINLSVSPRGMKVLAGHCDQKELLDLSVAMDGRVLHPENGRSQFVKYDDPDWHNYSLSRNELNVMLMRDAESMAGVRFEFGLRLSRIDFRERRAFFEAEDGSRAEAPYDLLVGADGAVSQLRENLAAEGFLTFHREELKATYREFALWPAEDHEDLTHPAIHLWPRKGFFMVALPNRDGSLRCTLVLPGDDRFNFSRLITDQAVKEFFGHHFPNAVENLRASGGHTSRKPVSTISVTTCSTLTHENSVLLMGDAAHSVAPFLGQGVNLGLEDCQVLEELLEKHRGDQVAVLSEYNRERKVDGDAASALSLANYAELTQAVPPNHSTVDRSEHDQGTSIRDYGKKYPLPVLVNFFDLAYREVLERYQSQSP